MDAVRKINKKGFALVYMALMIVVLVLLVSLAVDLGYVYVAKGQLQNAADAAALAGATKLGSTDEAAEVLKEATHFAKANVAAGDPVVVTDQDVVIGNYNAALNPANPFTPGATPHNAVQVTARRSIDGATAAEQGKIHTFFGGIFALLPGGGSGWSEMGAVSVATAIRPPRPAAGILLCDTWCSPTPAATGSTTTLWFDGPHATKKLGLDGKYVIAFSDYAGTPSVDFSEKSEVVQYINGTLESPIAAALCGKPIYSNHAASEVALTALQNRLAKEAVKTPSYWEVIVPLVKSTTTEHACIAPDIQGQSSTKPDETYAVTQFAKVRITGVYDHPFPHMDVEFRECISCANVDQVAGTFHSQLVKNNEGTTDKKK